MPIDLTGDVATLATRLSPDAMVATPWYITLIAAFVGAIIGGFITFATTYAKSRAEMSWELKQSALTALIDEVDQSEPRLPAKNKAIKRRARHLIHIAFKDKEIRDTAEKILGENKQPLETLQRIFDKELMPKIETDIKKTMKEWWKIWK